MLIALTLTPLILGVTKSGDWGWLSVATLGCFAIAVAAGFAFIAVEKRVAVPLLDLALLRNRVLVGSTIAILIGAGTINGLMYLLSLYFQNPAALDFSPLQAGLATLPATVGLVVVAPLVPRLAARFGGRQTIGVGFALTTVGFVVVGFVDAVVEVRRVPAAADRHRRRAWACPTAPHRRRRRHAVPENQVGGASGVSNMARYVGAAVATALAATIYGSRDRQPDRRRRVAGSTRSPPAWPRPLDDGGLQLPGRPDGRVIARHRAATGTLNDAAAAAAAHTHTLPTSATARRSGPSR